MKKNLKKMVMGFVACGLIATMAVGGTMAYMTDSEKKNNVFTIGQVVITLTEPDYPKEDQDHDGIPDQNEELVTRQEVDKDPTVTNTGTNDAIVFVQFDIPMEEVMTAAEDGTLENNGEAVSQELFQFAATGGLSLEELAASGNTTLTYNSVNDGWLEISAEPAADNSYMRYTYGFNTILAVGDSTISVFDVVRLIKVVEGQIDESTLEIPVRAYGIQADEVYDITDTSGSVFYGYDADEVGGEYTTFSTETLKGIYEIFYNQNLAGESD